MDINNHNYEEFAIDYLEGNLSTELEEKMKLFLLQNPEIEAELIGLEGIVLKADTSIIFPEKEILLQLERPSKVVPLYTATSSSKWKRYLLPIAAVLCLFFVWQTLLQTGDEEKYADENKGGTVEVAGKELKRGHNNKVDLAEAKPNIEEGGKGIEVGKEDAENDSEKKFSLNNKMKSHDFSIVENSASPSNTNTTVSSIEGEKEKGGLRKIEEEMNRSIEVKEVTENSTMIVEHEVLKQEGRGEVAFFERNENIAKVERNQRNVEGRIGVNGQEIARKRPEVEDKREQRTVFTLAALPQQRPEDISQQSIVTTNADFRELPHAAIPQIEIESKKQKSTFLNNLKKAILPEALASDEMEESSTDSEVLVAISLKPNQHDFVKKIFKNKR